MATNKKREIGIIYVEKLMHIQEKEMTSSLSNGCVGLGNCYLIVLRYMRKKDLKDYCENKMICNEAERINNNVDWLFFFWGST